MIRILKKNFAISHELRAMSYAILAMSLIALAITSCSGGKMDSTNKVSFPSIKDVPAEAWQNLNEKKIYFGHQSVGYNILDGVKDVMKENPPIKLQIVETNNPADFNAPVFAHSRVGKNTDPKSKCEDFSVFMDKGLGEKTDIAFLKLCYVDVTSNTVVEKVFAGYKETMSVLKSKYPKVTFVHITVPLTTLQTGPKAWIKKIIGRPVAGVDDNIKRETFNQKLRNEFSGKEPVFDLAAIESTLPAGSRAIFEKDGKAYPRLVPEYTDDGGHLNALGRKVAAEQLLIFLAKLVNQ